MDGKLFFGLALLMALAAQSCAQTAYIVDYTNATVDVYSSAAYRVYVDTFGTNPDFAMRLCDLGQKYVAAVYSANVSGTPEYVVVSKDLTTGSTRPSERSCGYSGRMPS